MSSESAPNLLFVQLILLFINNFVVADPLIQLPNGQILGREDVTTENKTFFAFESIPYAAPPIGNLRFQAPQPVENWDGVLNTTQETAFCHQRLYSTVLDSEDCLNLNVYTPSLPNTTNDVFFPVMFFIYGGQFVAGSTHIYYPNLFVDNDVILVTVNYRTGIFGFLSTQDDVIPGNNGLKDQQRALEWTHTNIQLFGGDPDKITIFGSASCAYQLLNLESTGLFRSAIIQSGTFLSPWAFQRRAREIAFAAASLVNSTFQTSNDSQALLDFLLSVEVIDLIAIEELYYPESLEYSEIGQGFVWAPVLEVKNPTAFLTKNMYGLLQAGNIIQVPIMIGMTSEENLTFNRDSNQLQSDLQQFDDNLDWLVPHDMQISSDSDLVQMGERIREIYTGGESLADHLGDGIRYFSDNSYTRSIIKYAEIYSQFAETYFYQVSFRGDLVFSPQYEGAERSGHGTELPYLFCAGNDCILRDYSENNRVFRRRIVQLWTDFAKYQNPTPEPLDLLQNITWPLLSIDDDDFFYLDFDEDLTIRNHPKAETYQAWNELYDSLNFTDFDTY